MRHGIVLFTCGRGITPAGAAKAAEERGFEAFYVSDPVTLAKTIATLDHLSGGRVTVGAGFGWNADELAEPVQAHVPLIIGAGGGPKTFGWIARHADGWMTTPGEQDISGKAASRSDHAP
jgi:alkanesulfonate monooxygenase SsuD/methylene tetrahydromethanopterin reductase-like flavin-dependent oxidoreductase (luciferase family)